MKKYMLGVSAIIGAFTLGYGLQHANAMFGIGGVGIIAVALVLADT